MWRVESRAESHSKRIFLSLVELDVCPLSPQAESFLHGTLQRPVLQPGSHCFIIIISRVFFFFFFLAM